MKHAGIFDRVRFLESRLDRLEVIILEQDALIREQGRLLGQAIPMHLEPSRKAITQIAGDVAADNGLTLGELRSKTRGYATSRPRQYAMMLMLDAGYSSAEVGRFFGMDHTTVLYGANAARKRQ